MNLKKLGVKFGLIDSHTTVMIGGWKAIYLDNELLSLEHANKNEPPNSLFSHGYYLHPPKNSLVVVNVDTEYEAIFLCGNHLRTYPISLSPFVHPEIDISRFKQLSENYEYFDTKIYVDGSKVTTLLYK